uniref:Uncharacterized protein n=1 Tax=Heterosigma akashiwo TaxID=2829 RepID=A0A6S9K5R2_HETAK|mmetsp:Transcript_7992/g.13775  ORF Transcript_7992/g.13775 Transcript_7992/m.13775 type:complete len:116 (-) Transcript_7992:26-373(-)
MELENHVHSKLEDMDGRLCEVEKALGEKLSQDEERDARIKDLRAGIEQIRGDTSTLKSECEQSRTNLDAVMEEAKEDEEVLGMMKQAVIENRQVLQKMQNKEHEEKGDDPPCNIS